MEILTSAAVLRHALISYLPCKCFCNDHRMFLRDPAREGIVGCAEMLCMPYKLQGPVLVNHHGLDPHV